MSLMLYPWNQRPVRCAQFQGYFTNSACSVDDGANSQAPCLRCAYFNGRIVPNNIFTNDFETAAIDESSCFRNYDNGTTTCIFHDSAPITKLNNRKRYYCIRQKFCDPRNVDAFSQCSGDGVLDSLTTTRCTTGLAYDGRPSDVVPTYSRRQGVKSVCFHHLVRTNSRRFQFLDTSIVESGFQIFRAPRSAKTTQRGQLVADVPVRSKTCGQQFAPLQYYDMDTGDVPQTRVDYLVMTVDSETGELTEAARIPYMTPWTAALAFNVETETTNEPVKATKLTVEHLVVRDEGVIEIDPNFRLELETDAFGRAEHEISVVDSKRWKAMTQRLKITPYKCEGREVDYGNGTVCESGLHVFDPPFETLLVEHNFNAESKVVDKTSKSVTGYVLFGEHDGGPADPFASQFGLDANYRSSRDCDFELMSR